MKANLHTSLMSVYIKYIEKGHVRWTQHYDGAINGCLDGMGSSGLGQVYREHLFGAQKMLGKVDIQCLQDVTKYGILELYCSKQNFTSMLF